MTSSDEESKLSIYAQVYPCVEGFDTTMHPGYAIFRDGELKIETTSADLPPYIMLSCSQSEVIFNFEAYNSNIVNTLHHTGPLYILQSELTNQVANMEVTRVTKLTVSPTPKVTRYTHLVPMGDVRLVQPGTYMLGTVGTVKVKLTDGSYYAALKVRCYKDAVDKSQFIEGDILFKLHYPEQKGSNLILLRGYTYSVHAMRRILDPTQGYVTVDDGEVYSFTVPVSATDLPDDARPFEYVFQLPDHSWEAYFGLTDEDSARAGLEDMLAEAVQSGSYASALSSGSFQLCDITEVGTDTTLKPNSARCYVHDGRIGERRYWKKSEAGNFSTGFALVAPLTIIAGVPVSLQLQFSVTPEKTGVNKGHIGATARLSGQYEGYFDVYRAYQTNQDGSMTFMQHDRLERVYIPTRTYDLVTGYDTLEEFVDTPDLRDLSLPEGEVVVVLQLYNHILPSQNWISEQAMNFSTLVDFEARQPSGIPYTADELAQMKLESDAYEYANGLAEAIDSGTDPLLYKQSYLDKARISASRVFAGNDTTAYLVSEAYADTVADEGSNLVITLAAGAYTNTLDTGSKWLDWVKQHKVERAYDDSVLDCPTMPSSSIARALLTGGTLFTDSADGELKYDGKGAAAVATPILSCSFPSITKGELGTRIWFTNYLVVIYQAGIITDKFSVHFRLPPNATDRQVLTNYINNALMELQNLYAKINKYVTYTPYTADTIGGNIAGLTSILTNAAAGVAVGAIAGPYGMLAGGAVGAVAGALTAVFDKAGYENASTDLTGKLESELREHFAPALPGSYTAMAYTLARQFAIRSDYYECNLRSPSLGIRIEKSQNKALGMLAVQATISSSALMVKSYGKYIKSHKRVGQVKYENMTPSAYIKELAKSRPDICWATTLGKGVGLAMANVIGFVGGVATNGVKAATTAVYNTTSALFDSQVPAVVTAEVDWSALENSMADSEQRIIQALKNADQRTWYM